MAGTATVSLSSGFNTASRFLCLRRKLAGAGSLSFSCIHNSSMRGFSLRHPRCRKLAIRAARIESSGVTPGFRPPHFELPEPLTGKKWSLEDFEPYPALLVMFICNHCPFVKHLKKDIVKLSNFYMKVCRYAERARVPLSDCASQACASVTMFCDEDFIKLLFLVQKGLAVVAISSNSSITHPQDGPSYMAEEAKLLNYPFPYLYDETQEVAKDFGAVCTPEFLLFKKDGRRPFELVYHGQFDDSRPSNNVPVTGRDLSIAIDCVLSGQPVPSAQKPSIGCSIKWHPDTKL